MPQNHVEQVVLARRLESSVTVNLLGAAVTSMLVNGVERLFLSKSTVLDNKSPIRSGIPFILSHDPAHDFFRTTHWTLVEQSKNPNGDVSASFALEDSDETRKRWNFRFKATLKISLRKKEVAFDYKIENKDSKPLACAPMLQNHFLVDDVTNTSILGLHDSYSSDEVSYGAVIPEGSDRVSVEGPLDRLYANSSDEHVLRNTQEGATLTLRKWNLPDSVIWNPWNEDAQGAHDITTDEYAEMICIGCGHVSQPVTILPGGTFHASQSFFVE
ncbi:uncharacterized protein [Diadema antillarum]|uniref:uncharacterized protein n=1 Tax=Diadema antillarum TaxID=105358 RepID=UPI003A8BFC13